jgi:hypothetical protein
VRRLLLVVLAALLTFPLVGCSNLAEKRAELARAQTQLHALTLELEQMRARLPRVVELEEQNKALDRQSYKLAVEVERLRKKVAEREARRRAALRRATGMKKNASGRTRL